VQLVNIHATIYITICMGIGKIWTVSKLPQPNLLSSRCWQMKPWCRMALPGPAGKCRHVIWAYLTARASAILYPTNVGMHWVVCKECHNLGKWVACATVCMQKCYSAIHWLFCSVPNRFNRFMNCVPVREKSVHHLYFTVSYITPGRLP